MSNLEKEYEYAKNSFQRKKREMNREEAGLDVKQLEADMQGEVVTRELANVRGMAQEFEINGTPFLIINEKAFPGAIPYKSIIEALEK